MIGVHFVEPIDATLIRVVPDGAKRTVGLSLRLCLLGLLVVCDLLDLAIEHPNREQLSVSRTTQDVLENSLAVRDGKSRLLMPELPQRSS